MVSSAARPDVHSLAVWRNWMQLPLFEVSALPDIPPRRSVAPFKTQLLKWVGSKQRFAHEIVGHFPREFGTYIEPFLGSGAVLGTLMPTRAIASDVLAPLIDIWRSLNSNPDVLKTWYAMRWQQFTDGDRIEAYERIKASYNRRPNAADLLFLSRSCYGGVVRFRRDGYMSTPCGIHEPVTPQAFDQRVNVWRARTKGTTFMHSDFEAIMDRAVAGDVVYCDPPYSKTQAILYGAQSFSLSRLLRSVEHCKQRGVKVALSIDGTKKSGATLCHVPLPSDLFEHEVMVNCGRSMLRRFQMGGETMEGEIVADRLLLTY